MLGGYDSDRVTGQFETYPLSEGTPWLQITGLVWESKGFTTSLMPNGTQSILGVLDPYVKHLTLPTASVSKFLDTTGTLNTGGDYTFYPSSEAPPGNMIITYSDGRNTTIPAQDLYQFPQSYDDKGTLQVTNNTIQQCLVVQAASDSVMWLGLPFMTQKLFISDFDQNVFYMADAVKQDFGSSAKNLQPLCTGGPTPTQSGASNATSSAAATGASKSSSSHVGAIVGGVLGGIAGLVLIGVLAFFLIHRRKKKTKDLNSSMHTPEISEPQYNGTPPPKYPNAYASNASSELGGTNQPFYNSGSTMPGLGVLPGHGRHQQEYGYSSGNPSIVPGGRADSDRHELESDGPLAATSGPMDLPHNYDQRWH